MNKLNNIIALWLTSILGTILCGVYDVDVTNAHFLIAEIASFLTLSVLTIHFARTQSLSNHLNDFHHVYNEIKDNLIDLNSIEKRINRFDSSQRKHNDEMNDLYRYHKEKIDSLLEEFHSMMQELMKSFNDDKIAQNEKVEKIQTEFNSMLHAGAELWEWLYANKESSDDETEVKSYEQMRKKLVDKLQFKEITPSENEKMDALEHQNIPILEGENISTERDQENLIIRVVKPGLRTSSSVLKKAEVYLSTLSNKEPSANNSNEQLSANNSNSTDSNI